MKKNLKKVISAVLSLTLAMSSFVALSSTTSAATFADVADTANYAEAVNALAALGAISGYEDGTFLPDNKITRAEVTTMVVAALNMTEDAKNSGSTTKFDDVNAPESNWAAGYVNVGVSQGFISGMSDTEFAPKANVTYAQILTMLTRILGYGDYAVSRGGYPDGYLEAARAAGILTGVTAAASDDMTRAQVAQLIWNAVKAPKLDTTNFSANLMNISMEKMDGTDDKPFVTVLSERYGAYVLNITVEDTSKMSANSLEIGEITMKLTGNNDWDPEYETLVKDAARASDLVKSGVAAGETDAEEYPFSSAKVVATYIDDEWKLVYFAPTSKISTRTVDSTLLNASQSSFAEDSKVVAINKSKNSTSNPTKYKLSNSAKLYVNGVEFCDIDSTNEALVESLLLVAADDAVLYEDPDATGTKYNRIMIDAYTLASVSQVRTTGDDVVIRLANVKAPVSSGIASPAATITVDADKIADGEQVVTVTKAGADIDASALVKDDVIAIKYDLSQSFANCRTIDILATDEKVVGQYTTKTDDDKYVVAGEEYSASAGVNLGSLSRGTTYTFRLDPMGNLFSAAEEASTKMYAIVERYVDVATTESSYEYNYAEVMTLDGQKKTLQIDQNYADDASLVMKNMGLVDPTSGKGYTQKYVAANVDIADRIISYTVKSSGKVNKIEDVTAEVATFTDENYNEAANVLGKRIASDATVLNATNYDTTKPVTTDYEASALSNLLPTVKYTGILVHKNNSAAYAYVIVTGAGSIYGSTSDFAVAAVNASSDSATYVNEEEVYTLRVVDLEGTETTKYLNINLNAKVYYHDGSDYVTTGNSYENECANIRKGAAFFYTTDADGLVDRIDVILKGNYGFNDVLTSGLKVNLPENIVDGKTIYDDDWRIGIDPTWGSNADNEIQIFYAPVVSATSSSVTFGSMGTDYVDTSADYSFSVTSDANIYSYDLSDTAPTNYEAFGLGSFDGMDLASTEEDGKAYFTTLGADIGEKYDFDGQFQMAFVMAVDGIVTNAIVFNN